MYNVYKIDWSRISVISFYSAHLSFYLIFVFFMLYKHDSLFMCASES